jgi:hypothetical protein
MCFLLLVLVTKTIGSIPVTAFISATFYAFEGTGWRVDNAKQIYMLASQFDPWKLI